MKTTRIGPLAMLLLAAGCGGSGGTPPSYAVTGTVSGLAAGVGVALQLQGPSGVLQNLTVTADGAFQFTARLPDAATWTVVALPSSLVPRQTCAVAPGTGTIAAADAAVAVTCTTDTFAVTGTVADLAADSSVTLRGPGGDLVVTAAGGAASTPFAFPVRVASGAAYEVTVAQQPGNPAQTCRVAGGGPGTVAAADVVVTVTCEADVKPVAGLLSGLAGATGLVLQVNGAHDTPLTANGAFQVLTSVSAGATWTLTVKTQPTDPWQTCTATLGPPPSVLPATGTMGAAGAGGVRVTCATDAFSVGGTVTGLLLPGLTLSLDGGAPLAVDGDGSFVFPAAVASGAPWLVQVVGAPASQACAVSGGSGTMAGAPVADVVVTCGCAAGLGDCGPGPGCETDLGADAAHCGACNHPCGFPNAGAHCAAGSCVMDACTTGYGDCGPGSGCETNLSSDAAHCGACNQPCSFPNAGATCAAGSCAQGACLAGFGDCDGAAPGCETDVRSSLAHCGGCNSPCAPPNASGTCEAGTCRVVACDPGFGDCDGTAPGCEANLSTDVLNCGACLRACSFANAPASCAGGGCQMGTCDPGFGDCNLSSADGCEVDLSTDPLHCGTCQLACALPHAQPSCGGGSCNTAHCDAGWGDCNPDVTDGCETDLAGSTAHCGSCGRACGPGQACDAGQCVAPESCRAVLQASPGSPDGEYLVDPDGAGPGGAVTVYCDMTTDGGGWTFFAHVGGDYAGGLLFEQDLPTYLSSRANPVNAGTGFTVSYGLGASLYQPLLARGAGELMVSVNNKEPGVTLGSSLVFYRVPPGAGAFARGPLPCSATDLTLAYRTILGSYLAGLFAACDADLWYPYTGDPGAGGEPLVMLNAAPVGTIWGTGAGALPPPGSDNLQNLDSWWYVR